MIADDAVPVPARITMALDARGLYGPDVDTACGAAEPDVDEWESGESVPTRHQVELLAELTHMPVEFFYEPWVEAGVMIVCQRSGRSCRSINPVARQPKAPHGRQAALW